MLTASFHNPYDPLQRSELIPEPVRGGRIASRIGLGALGGLLLAAAGSLDPKDSESIDRRALAGEPPRAVSVAESPWGRAHGSEDRFSH